MLIDKPALLLGSLLLFPYICYRLHRVKKVWQAFESLPARFLLFSPLNVFTRLLPRIPWISDALALSGENVFERKSVPDLMSAFLSSSHSMPRRVRSFRFRYCPAAITVSVRYPATSTRRCYSYQGGTSLQVSAFMLNLSM